MITKPHVSGAAYINKMSDYCVTCAFNPKKNCPNIFLCWCFLARHESRLLSNPQLRMPYISLKKRDKSLRKKDFAVFIRMQKALEEAEPVTPKDLD